MSPYFTKIRLAEIFNRSDDFITRGIDKQMKEVTCGETVVDLVDFYGELYQFFLGALGFDLDCEFVSTNAKFHNTVIQELLKWIPQQFQGFTKLFQMRFNSDVNDTICHLTKLRNLCEEILDYKIAEIKKRGGADPTDILHHVVEAGIATATATKNGYSKQEMRINAMDDIMT
eukprot:sb/3472071/